MKQQQPKIYAPTWKCCICNAGYEETWDHIWLCHRQRDEIEQCIDLLIDKITELSTPHLSMNRSDFIDNLRRLTIWTFPMTYPYFVRHHRSFNLLDLIRGLIPHALINTVRNGLNCQARVNDIVIESVDYFLVQLYIQIWKPHYEITIEKQEQMGITRKVKRNRRRGNNNYLTVKHHSTIATNTFSTSQHVNNYKTDDWLIWIEKFIHTGSNFMIRLDFSSSVFLRIFVV